MIEYLYDAIRVSAGDDATIAAVIKDAGGAYITDQCYLMIYDGDTMLLNIGGVYKDDVWNFTIPSTFSATTKRGHRYFYCVCDCNHNNICFRQPIYFI
jgi:hypothetical protein